MDPIANLRHEWFQSDAGVTVNVLLKNNKPKEVIVKFSSSSVDVVAQFEGYTDYKLHLNLFSDIVQDQCSWKTRTSMIEIKMKKASSLRWSDLEKSATFTAKNSVAPAAFGEECGPCVPTYPTSSKNKRDWDKIISDVQKQEKEEENNDKSEAAVNRLFQDIFHNGSEDVKRAMNKSFAESGGTVLSTNWKEVGEKTVEMKPPDGMEFKKY